MDAEVAEFWRKWYRAGELGRLELVETLTLPSNIRNKKVFKHHTVSLINSYLSDFAEWMEHNVDERHIQSH